MTASRIVTEVLDLGVLLPNGARQPASPRTWNGSLAGPHAAFETSPPTTPLLSGRSEEDRSWTRAGKYLTRDHEDVVVVGSGSVARSSGGYLGASEAAREGGHAVGQVAAMSLHVGSVRGRVDQVRRAAEQGEDQCIRGPEVGLGPRTQEPARATEAQR